MDYCVDIKLKYFLVSFIFLVPLSTDEKVVGDGLKLDVYYSAIDDL